MRISKQWTVVLLVVMAIGVGVAGLMRLGAEVKTIDAGTSAPDYRAVNLGTGDTVSLRKEYVGGVTLVNIWATWCLPCRIEMPAMQKAYDALAPQGFRIAAVSVDEGKPEDVSAFAHELNLTFDILHDQSGHIQQVYQTTGVPESFLLNRQGVVVKRIIGAYDWNSPANRALIERLIAEPAR